MKFYFYSKGFKKSYVKFDIFKEELLKRPDRMAQAINMLKGASQDDVQRFIGKVSEMVSGFIADPQTVVSAYRSLDATDENSKRFFQILLEKAIGELISNRNTAPVLVWWNELKIRDELCEIFNNPMVLKGDQIWSLCENLNLPQELENIVRSKYPKYFSSN